MLSNRTDKPQAAASDAPAYHLSYGILTLMVVGTVMIRLLFCAFIGVTLVLPLGMQEVQRFSTLEAGLSFLPGLEHADHEPVVRRAHGPLPHAPRGMHGRRAAAGGGAILMLHLGEMESLTLIMLFQGVRAFDISSLIQPLITWSVRTLAGPLIPDDTSISNTLCQVAGAFVVSACVLLMSIGGATVSVSAFGVDAAMAFSTLCAAVLAVLAFTFVRN